ncbi:MAG: histidine kinase [Bacteroidetes bacterium]|nr:histidine kinase [Bacteroidota bacterium]
MMRTLKETGDIFLLPRNVKALILVVLIIAGVLELIYYPDYPELKYILSNVIFTTVLTSLSFFMVIWFRAVEYEKFSHRILYSYLSLTLSGFFGTLIATAIVLTFNEAGDWPRPFPVILASNMMITFIAGTVVNVWSYYELKVVDLAEKLAQKELTAQRAEMLHARAKMESLRAKVNPHFLFNTLNSISSLVYSNPDLADDMIQKLANLFRYSLDYESDDTIDLEKELSIAGIYLDIEKVRLNDRLKFTVSVDEALKTFQVPPFLIQPLVENSIRHGIAPKSAPGKIEITARQTGSGVVLSVSDNGTGFSGPVPEHRFGLKGVLQRLKLHFGEAARMEIENSNGTTIRLIIPDLREVTHA